MSDCGASGSECMAFSSGVPATGGSLVKVGTGTLTLSGDNTYTGGTTVNGGVLDGSIASSSLTNMNDGGTLSGTGAVGNLQVNSGGIFAPGNGTPGTSMNVAGNLAFQSLAQYMVFVNSSTSSFANVTGTATLTGGTVVANVSLTSPVSKTYLILHSAGLGGKTFAGLVVNNPNFLRFLSYDPNTNVFLTLEPQLGVGANLTSETSPARSITSSIPAAPAAAPRVILRASLAAISPTPWTKFPAKPPPARRRPPSSSAASF